MPAAEHFLDIEVALGMPAAGRVGVGEFVHQHKARAAGQDRVDVHLGQAVAAIGDDAARDDFQSGRQRLGFGPAMGFDDADDDVDLSRRGMCAAVSIS